MPRKKLSVDEKLGDALNIEVVPTNKEITPPSPVDTIKDTITELKEQEKKIDNIIVEDVELQKDFEFARGNLRRLILRAEEAYENAGRVAEESENPRAYEVLSQLIKITQEANNSLIQLHRQKMEIAVKNRVKPASTPNSGGISIDKAIFTGTTTELQKFLEKGESTTP